MNRQDEAALVQVVERYKAQVSQHYLSLIDPDDPNCPIRLQAIPAIEELQTQSWEMKDPIGDKAHSPTRLFGPSLSRQGFALSHAIVSDVLPILLS